MSILSETEQRDVEERTARIQLTSHKNEWLSRPTDPDWVYSYDALTVPLGAAR